jgi:hypothetical protein
MDHPYFKVARQPNSIQKPAVFFADQHPTEVAAAMSETEPHRTDGAVRAAQCKEISDMRPLSNRNNRTGSIQYDMLRV